MRYLRLDEADDVREEEHHAPIGFKRLKRMVKERLEEAVFIVEGLVQEPLDLPLSQGGLKTMSSAASRAGAEEGSVLKRDGRTGVQAREIARDALDGIWVSVRR